MIKIKKLAALITAVCIIAALVSGCTKEASGKALYDAIAKSQTVKSSRSDMQFTISLDASGMSEEEQAKFEQLKALFNGAAMKMSMMQAANDYNTLAKAQAGLEMTIGGIAMNMDIWVDMDLTGKTPKLREIIKLPTALTASVPGMAGKEYMVLDVGRIMSANEGDGQSQSPDFAEIMMSSNEFQEKAKEFLAKYLAQYDPGFELVTDGGTREVETPEGIVNAHVYQIKLDDSAAKKLIRYTVNNFVNNEDAMNLLVEYLKLVQSFNVETSGVPNPINDLEKAINDFKEKKQAKLDDFNKFMDQIENVQLVGDKGITFEFAVDENGYIVSQSGTVDLVIDRAKLGELGDSEAVETAEPGVFYVGLDFNILTYDINKGMKFNMPVVTPENSINYGEIQKMMEPAQPAGQELSI